MDLFSRISIALFLGATAFSSVHAQFEVFPSTHIFVFQPNGNTMPNPWTGGLNAVQLSMFDADGDGLQDDIFLFDRSGDRVLVFTGSIFQGVRDYTFRPGYSSQFPTMKHWALLRDFNCDGKADIFTYSALGGGFATWLNTTLPGGPLTFTIDNDLIFSKFQFNPNSFINANIYTSPADIPAIIDADGDGDLDIFTFSVTGTQMEYHENLTMDEDGACGTQKFRAANMCYGQFSEGSESNEITLGQPCNLQVINPKSGDSGGLRHVGTTIFAHDLNGDGVIDIVLGGVSFNNLTFLENSTGTNGVDSVVATQPDFPAGFGAPAADIDNFVSAFYEDITGNGVKDLILGVNEAFIARNTRSVWMYENLGTDNEPVFSLLRDDFLQGGTIDHGEVAAPVFADVNGDGLADMVVGSRGAFVSGTFFKPTLSLYLNTGTPTSPQFQLIESDWLQVSELGIGQYAHPTFGDIDGDGDLDLVVGDLSGRVFLLRNTAGAGNAMAFDMEGPLMADGTVIDVGQTAAPQLFDLDQDGLPDLIVGERNGNINYYRNNGSSLFTLVTEELGDLDTVEFGLFIGSSAPHFFRYEGTTWLLIGVESGRLHLYNGIDGNETGAYTLSTLNAFGVAAGEKSRPFVIDIDSDGLPDLFCGSIGGGVLLYTGDPTLSTATRNRIPPPALDLYPNPAQGVVHIERDGEALFGTFRVTALTGKTVMQGHLNGRPLEVQRLPTGAYVLEVEADGQVHRKLWLKQ